MKRLFIVLLMLTIVDIGLSDDVYLKNGESVKNCKINNENESFYYIAVFSNDFKSSALVFDKKLIDHVDYIDIDSTHTTQINSISNDTQLGKLKINKYKFENPRSSISTDNYAYKIKPIPGLMAVSSFLLCWDFLSDYCDIKKAKKEMEDYANISNVSLDEFDEEMTQKLICGIGFGIIGAINVNLALERIEIQTDNNSLTLSYKF